MARKSLTWTAWVYSRAFFLLNITPQCCTLLESLTFILLYKPRDYSLVHYGYLAAVIMHVFILYCTSQADKGIIRRDDGVDKESAQICAWWPDRICGVSRGANVRCGGRFVTSTQVWTVEGRRREGWGALWSGLMTGAEDLTVCRDHPWSTCLWSCQGWARHPPAPGRWMSWLQEQHDHE